MITRGEVDPRALYTPAVDAQLAAVDADTLFMSQPEGNRWRTHSPLMAHYLGEIAMARRTPGFEPLETLLREDIVLNPDRMAIARVNALPRHVNYFHYMNGGITKDNAQTAMHWVDAVCHDQIVQDDFRRNNKYGIRTQIGDRGWVIQAVGILSGLDHPVNILEIGGGQVHDGEKLLAGPSSPYPFRLVDLHLKALDGGFDRHSDAALYETRKINIINREMHLPIGKIVSVDLLDPLKGIDTEEARRRRKWEISSNYTEEHWYDLPRIEEYWHWENNPSDRIHHLQHDARNLDTDALLKLVPEGFDLIVFSYSGYQMRESGMAATLRSLPKVIREVDGKPKATALATDEAWVNDDGELVFIDKRRPWGTGTFMFDFADPEQRWRKIIAAKNGRMGQARLLPAIGRLPLAREFGLASPRHAQMAAA